MIRRKSRLPDFNVSVFLIYKFMFKDAEPMKIWLRLRQNAWFRLLSHHILRHENSIKIDPGSETKTAKGKMSENWL